MSPDKADRALAREYFCNTCGQLRLCLDSARTTCGRCASRNLLWGKPGELDKDKLKEEYRVKHPH
jgi:DNA-directed RNA polymerase subunit RPC12/RpoP